LRFLKSFSGHLPFGTKDAYVKEIMGADLEKLANLIRICGFLLQTKAYLLKTGCGRWNRNSKEVPLNRRSGKSILNNPRTE